MVRSKKEINNYLDEACDRVWFMRSNITEATEGIPEDIKQKALEEQLRISKSYDWKDCDRGDHLYFTDWYYGFWNGVLGTLRWVLGEDDKKFLDT